MEYRIDDLLDEYMDDSVPLNTISYTSAETIKEKTMKKINHSQISVRRTGHKRIFTIAIAAALVFALSITGFAALHIHQQRQDALRNTLQVDENNVVSYVEYDSETNRNVTLLSTINDGQFQKVYVNISPVSEDDARSGLLTDAFRFSTDGGKSGGTANVPFDPDRLDEVRMVDVYNELDGKTFQSKDPEQMKQLMMDYSYDKETQTLTLECNIWKDALSNTVHLSILRFNEAGEKVQDYGTVTFNPTAAETKVLHFTAPVELYNETLQESCRVVGIRLSPTSAAWMVEIEEAQTLFGKKNLTKAETEAQLSWLNCIDQLSNAALVMTDGSEFKPGIIVSDPYENGMLLPTTAWTTTIDINAVTGAHIGTHTVSCK